MDSTPTASTFELYYKLNHKKIQSTLSFILLVCVFFVSYFYIITSSLIDSILVFAFFAVLVLFLASVLHHPRIFSAKSFPDEVSVTNSIQSSCDHVVWSIGSDHILKKSDNSGYWVKYFKNGDLYEGEFHKGKCSGSGVYHYYMCGKYEGDWVEGKYEGYGVETWVRGSRYRGQYRNGLKNGVGAYKFYTGDVYEGEWFNGQCHGCGVHASEDGSMYVGEFKWGIKHGFGHYHYRDGDVYAGEYFADKMHGFGVYKFGNGHQYEGSWHEGRRQGLGVYIFRNEEAQSGYWRNGLLDKDSNQNELSGISAYSCKVSDVVQKARQASQRAYNVVTADDRVKKVVTAANRAANAARVAAAKAVQRRMQEGTNSRALVPNA